MIIRGNTDDTTSIMVTNGCITLPGRHVTLQRVLSSKLIVNDAILNVGRLNTIELIIAGNTHIEIETLGSRGFPIIDSTGADKSATLTIDGMTVDIFNPIYKTIKRPKSIMSASQIESVIEREPMVDLQDQFV